jgi:head-tail adaptor
VARRSTRNSRCGGCADARNVNVTLATVSGRTSDLDGGWTDTYTNLTPPTDWVSMASASAEDIERIFGNTLTVAVTEIVSMRYRADMNMNARITFTDAGGTHVLYVRGLRDVERRNVELKLACSESIAVAVVPA